MATDPHQADGSETDGNETASTESAVVAKAGTEKTGTEKAGTEQDGTEKAGAEQDGTEKTGTEKTGTEEGREPDYRFSMANDRTFLAWNRTVLGLLAGAVAIVQLVGGKASVVAKIVAFVLVALAVLLTVSSYLGWQDRQRRMRLDQPLGHSRIPMILATTLVGVSALVLLIVVLAVSG